MKYKWGIPSYKRAKAPLTVNLLNELGFTKEEIIVSTQTETDYEEYKKEQGENATIIFRRGENDSMNRNNVLGEFGEGQKVLLADDDIKAFCKLSADGKKLEKISSRYELEYFFDAMFAYCKKNNAKIWAWYPVENAFFMKHTIDDKNILCGTLFGIEKDRRFMFNDSYSLKGDFELSLRYIKSGYNAVRFNGFTCAARHKSSGGCSDARKNGENESRYQELLRKYPELIKASKRTGEIKYVGETKHTQESELYG